MEWQENAIHPNHDTPPFHEGAVRGARKWGGRLLEPSTAYETRVRMTFWLPSASVPA
jgi:hypothetical protein